jgi:hypothetical protein
MKRKNETVNYCIESSFDLEIDALARERTLIKLFGRHDLGLGPLTNQTDGGEGASNPSEESRERKRQNLWGNEAENDERRIANRFFQQICSVQSVPVKPVSDFKRERLFANRSSFAMSPRQAAALATSAIANRVLLVPSAVLPRLLILEEIPMVIENGVGRDILSSGMAMLSDTNIGRESFSLTVDGYQYIVSVIGRDTLISAGVLDD